VYGKPAVRFNKFFAVLATTVILLLLAVTIFSTPAFAAPIITLSPTSGTVGTPVTASGENFVSYAGDQVHIYFGNTEVGSSPVTVPANGKFSLTFEVPESAMPGTALVTVRDKNGNQLGESALFDIPRPFIVGLSPAGGVVGTGVTLTSRGFHANETVTFTYSNTTQTELGSARASDIGECTYSFNIPESTGKEHKVIAADEAGDKAEAVFTVIPSIVLDPVSGAIGDTVTATGTGFGHKSRLNIELEQQSVATDRSDDNGSFKTTFEVPDMPLQTYSVTISDTEDNTAVTPFTINAGVASFVFPQWGIYALMGLVAVGLFLLGIWIGRKFAYSY